MSKIAPIYTFYTQSVLAKFPSKAKNQLGVEKNTVDKVTFSGYLKPRPLDLNTIVRKIDSAKFKKLIQEVNKIGEKEGNLKERISYKLGNMLEARMLKQAQKEGMEDMYWAEEFNNFIEHQLKLILGEFPQNSIKKTPNNEYEVPPKVSESLIKMINHSDGVHEYYKTLDSYIKNSIHAVFNKKALPEIVIKDQKALLKVDYLKEANQ